MAALDLEQFQKAMGNLFKDVAKAIPNMTQERALTAKALIVQRIRTRGIEADGSEFPEYSEGYKKVRQKAGRQVDHTDLTFTGRMLNNLQIVSTGRDSSGYFVEISAKAVDEVKKLRYNEEHYGDFLKTSKQEEKLLTQDFEADIQDIINKNGFGK